MDLFFINGLKDQKFKDCWSVIKFIRNIDNIFEYLNSGHAFEKCFKAPICNFNLTVKKKVIDWVSVNTF